MNIEKEFHELKNAIADAGKIAYAYFDSDDTRYEHKPDKSVVTAVDKNIETALLAHIKDRFPDDAIVGEEHGEQTGTSGFVWHIDPIDGTDNFLRKVPFCGISVARLGDRPEGSFGIVYNPLTKQMFSSLAEEEGGVYENERICKLTPEPIGGKYVIALGRGTEEQWMKPAAYALNEALGMKYGRCTSYHCTALELAYIAANRFDAYLTFGLHSYDYAAGLFLAKSAGAAISVFEKGQWSAWSGTLKELCSVHGRIIFVSHPAVHAQILGDIGDPVRWGTHAKI